MTDSTHRLGKLTGKTISWYEDSGKYSNRVCLYCGIEVGGVGDEPSNKEHLIGRNFVPTGTIGAEAFNFIFRACVACNSRKAIAERHVSSVTLISGPGRLEDSRAATAAERKAVKDFHPDKPGIPMGQAHEQMAIGFERHGMSGSVGFSGPPNANADAVMELALSHVQGLFPLVTTSDFRDVTAIRLLPGRQVTLLGSFGRSDWGNPHLVEVARRAAEWPCHVSVISADGYFKAIMRRHESQGWFWALEWNKYLRIAGGISISEMGLFQELPDAKWFQLPGSFDRAREEVPLTERGQTPCSGRLLTVASSSHTLHHAALLRRR